VDFILPKVVHRKKERYDVYIGRGRGIWGNPFEIGIHGTRDEVIEKYKEWILTQPTLLDRLWTLEGKVLGCSCAPLRCHGDVLVALCNERFNSPAPLSDDEKNHEYQAD
jgi:hypothetical protein